MSSNWAEDDNFWDETAPPETAAASENAPSAPPPKGPFCPQCGSRDIEPHSKSGESICTACGLVVEENCIVNSVQFQEGIGASAMVGQFVAHNASTAYSSSRGRSFGFSRDSREMTLAKGRKRIQEVASRLRLNNHFVDCAARMYTVAVEKNFTQGRRGTHVVAACLYMACRMENSQHMLIDFSDALAVNVYTLGTCFLKFRRLLGYKLKVVDPALYVYRFAAHLDLGTKANAVALTALRIVGRMQRDWIVCGRRPAGICAAALLIASRAHGFSRTKHDVTKILRVCGMTVHQRIRDFENTPSSSLTLDQFHTMELENEADPPSFTRNKIREARARALQDNNVELLTSGALDNPRDGKNKENWRNNLRLSDLRKKQETMYDEIGSEMMIANNTDGTTTTTNETITEKVNNDDEEKEEEDDEEKDDEEQDEDYNDNESTALVPKHSSNDLRSVTTTGGSQLAIRYPRGPNRKPVVLPDQATAIELTPSVPRPATFSLGDWKVDMPDGAADEMESLFRSDDEVAQKEAIFNTLNKEYLQKMKQKELDLKYAEEHPEEAEKEEQRKKKLNRKKRLGWKHGDQNDGVNENENGEPISIEDALKATVSSRKVSRKINYDAMSSLFDEDGDFATDMLDDNEESEEAGDVLFQNV